MLRRIIVDVNSDDALLFQIPIEGGWADDWVLDYFLVFPVDVLPSFLYRYVLALLLATAAVIFPVLARTVRVGIAMADISENIVVGRRATPIRRTAASSLGRRRRRRRVVLLVAHHRGFSFGFGMYCCREV